MTIPRTQPALLPVLAVWLLPIEAPATTRRKIRRPAANPPCWG